MLQLYIDKYCFPEFLNEEFKDELVKSIIHEGLSSDVAVINNNSSAVLSVYALTASHEICGKLSNDLTEPLGDLNTKGLIPAAALRKAVFGLSGLIGACQNEIPWWLPECVTKLALLSNRCQFDFLKV